MAIERREFIRRAGLVGGAAAAVGALPGCRRLFQHPPFHLPTNRSMLECRPSDSEITHVVVVMMENRSFDHWVGWLADDREYLEAGRRRYGRRFCVDGKQRQTIAGPDGPVETTHLPEQPGQVNPFRGCNFEDPGHGWISGRAQRDGGFLAPESGNDIFATGYYLPDDLPFTSKLARRFTTFDRYHASILGPTFPNREYLHSGQSGGTKSNDIPLATGGFTWETIWERLAAANVPCRYYYSDLPVLALWGNRVGGFIQHVDNFYAECANGTLPNVTFVDPKFLDPGRNDDHPHADIRGGQDFVRKAFDAFTKSPHWRNGLFIMNYDEWGGFYDHVKPPHLPDDRASTDDLEDFSQAGFRVPTVIASPFARPGYVDHRTYDHASVLRFLEWRFLGAPPEGPGRQGDSWFLTKRDRYAANLGASLLAKRVTDDVGFDPAAIPIAPMSALCDTGPETLRAAGAPEDSTALATPTPEAPEAPAPPDEDEGGFLALRDSGFLEQVGAPSRP